MYITEDHVGAFFAEYGPVEVVTAIKSKAGISTGDLNREAFKNIPNIITCRDRSIYVVVEGRRPFCWVCSKPGHLAKSCPGKKPVLQAKQATAELPCGGSTKRNPGQ